MDLSCLGLNMQRWMMLKFNLFLLVMDTPPSWSYSSLWLSFLQGWLLRIIAVCLVRGGAKNTFWCHFPRLLQRLGVIRAGTSPLARGVPNRPRRCVPGGRRAMTRPLYDVPGASEPLGGLGRPPGPTYGNIWRRHHAHLASRRGSTLRGPKLWRRGVSAPGRVFPIAICPVDWSTSMRFAGGVAVGSAVGAANPLRWNVLSWRLLVKMGDRDSWRHRTSYRTWWRARYRTSSLSCFYPLI